MTVAAAPAPFAALINRASWPNRGSETIPISRRYAPIPGGPPEPG